ncbi:MAG TPA: mechanosensitive ion channel, partial [Candidatus Hydrogenedentes bacterium]|nr:mechanosensitive ion channel [Candidatus Hydrogenedentota bacterium]
ALETAKLAREALEARLKEAEAAVCRAASRREQAEVDLELARVRARWVEERTLYRLEELENRQQEEKNTLQSIEKARVKVRRELEKRQAELAAMRRAQEKNPDDPIAMEKALRREQSALEMLDILNESVALESAYTDLLKRRLAAMNPELAREFQLILTLNEWLDFFRKQQQRYESLRNSEQQRLIALQTELNDWEATTGDDNATPRDPMGAVMVPLLRERIPLLDRLVTRYGDLAFLAARGVEQVNDRLVSRSLIDRLYARVTEIRKHAGIWLDYGLIDTGGVPVTPRKLIAAVFILAIGMMLVRLLMGRLRAGLFRRLKERSHAAYVAETLLHYALILLVGYITLRYLNIPLTVFAFLGGAVAIGVGFGAQNLISNFLSGLILMGEQQVRLNDIVEVDGLTGRVTHIGARTVGRVVALRAD